MESERFAVSTRAVPGGSNGTHGQAVRILAVAPALLAMVVLLQAYTGASDAQAVELAVVDARWQMVLGVIGQDEPPFSQGALPAFRQRLMAHEMDRRLLERTIELALKTGRDRCRSGGMRRSRGNL